MNPLTTGLLIWISSFLPGALPPQAIRHLQYNDCLLQAKAPERLRIRIVKVRHTYTWWPRRKGQRRRWRTDTLHVTAKVLKIDKTSSRLKVNRIIRFSYSFRQRQYQNMPGPWNRPKPKWLSKGQVVWAFLRHLAGATYTLAASTLSFANKRAHIQSDKQWQAYCQQKYGN